VEAEFPSTGCTVVFDKWTKYQESSSYQRVKRWREKQAAGTGKDPLHETPLKSYGNSPSNAFGNQRREEKRRTPYPRDPDTDPAHLRFNIPDA
jgi:hypothetical protein